MVISYKLNIMLFTLLAGVFSLNLVGAEAEFTPSQSKGRELLQAILDREPLEVIKGLIEGADVNYKDYTGRTPLIWALAHEDVKELVPMLAKEGADVNAIASGGHVLWWVLGHENAKELLPIFLRAGSNPELVGLVGKKERNLLDRIVAQVRAETDAALLEVVPLPTALGGVIGDIAYGPKK